MKRGSIVLVRENNSPASKLRPCVIVQRTSTLESAIRIVSCPLTTMLRGARGGRPFVLPTPENGLHRPCEVEVDWVYGFSKDRIQKQIGEMEEQIMAEVDHWLRLWLDL